MPTARELLEQAEALMRRDRMAALAAEDDFPVLTDAVADPPADDALAVASAPGPAVVIAPLVTAAATPAPVVAPAPAPVPVPEPAVARLVSEHADVRPDQQGAPSIWAVPPDAASTITETGPDSLSPLLHGDVPPPARETEMAASADVLWRDDVPGERAEIVETLASEEISVDASLVDRGEEIIAPVDDFPLDATLDATRWNLMAEDIRMQVLQRIDIFTDTGLREQLTQRLQPIVDRASADLVTAINQHVGQILREYVAEAIEREIEKWRQQPH